jgi:hypothetical protein
MSSVVGERESEERRRVVETLKDQIRIEGELIDQYKEFGLKIMNVPVRRMLHMIMYDSQKHIEALQAAIDIINGEDILKDDRKELKDALKKHLEIEAESLKTAERVLKHSWIQNTKGLKELLESWKEEEKRHHQTLKNLSEKPFIELDSNDWITLFQGEEFLEERYLRAKRFKEKLKLKE